jgi:hypothetical protein
MSHESIPAPGLCEVAQVWWDSEQVPVVRWRRDATVFVLVGSADEELLLARLTESPADPRAVASVLAEGLAACDFPPTGDGAAPSRVAATLRAAGRPEQLSRG